MVTKGALRVATRFCARDGLDQKLALATALCDVQVEQCWYIIEVWKSTRIDLFSLCVLFYQYRYCDDTLGKCFFQISYNSRAYVRIIYENTKGQIPLGPLLWESKRRS